MAIKNLLNVKEHSMLHLGDSARGHHCSRPNMTLLAACLRTTRALPTVVTLAPPGNMEKYLPVILCSSSPSSPQPKSHCWAQASSNNRRTRCGLETSNRSLNYFTGSKGFLTMLTIVVKLVVKSWTVNKESVITSFYSVNYFNYSLQGPLVLP